MIERFLKLLIEATARVPLHYFQLPVAEREDPIYRERVYCYELYHQLRTLLEDRDLPARCRRAAETHYALEPACERQLSLYHELAYSVARESAPADASEFSKP